MLPKAFIDILTCEKWVYREAWSTDTFAAHTVAVGTILAPAHLLAGLPIKSWSARLIAVESGPTRLTCTLP